MDMQNYFRAHYSIVNGVNQLETLCERIRVDQNETQRNSLLVTIHDHLQK